MMKLFFYEIRKLFTGKAPLIFLLVILSAALFFDLRQEWDRYYPYEAYAKLCNDVLSLPEEERENYLKENADKYNAFYSFELGMISSDDEKNAQYILQYENSAETIYTDSFFAEYSLFSDVYEQYTDTCHYSQHISDILAQAEKMSELSVFGGKNSFEQKNISAAAAAYKALNGLTPRFADTAGLNFLLSFSADKLLILAAAVFGAFVMVMDERRTGSLRIENATKNGRTFLALSKTGAVFVWCAANSILLLAVKLIITAARYDISAIFLPIQSLSGFVNCPYALSTAEYIAIASALGCFAAFVCAMLFAFVFTLKKYIIGSAAGVIFTVLQFAAYERLDGLSSLGVFKYFNISAALHFSETEMTFTTVNLFQEPVDTFTVSAAFLLIFALLFCAAFVFSFAGSYMDFQGISLNIRSSRIPSANLFCREVYRVFITKGGLAVLILLLCVTVYDVVNDDVHYEAVDGYYELYLNDIEQMTLSETADFIKEEEKRLSDLQNKLSELNESYQNGEITSGSYVTAATIIQSELAKRPALRLLSEQYRYISEEKPSANFVYYKKIDKYMNFDNSKDDIKSSLYTQLALVLVICTLFSGLSVEERRLISCTADGKGKLLRIRTYICILSAAAIFLCIALPEMITLLYHNRSSDLSAAIQSLTYFRGLTANISIGIYFVLMYLLRLAFVLFTALLIAFIGITVKEQKTVIVLCSVIILLPTASALLFGPEAFPLIYELENNMILRRFLI